MIDFKKALLLILLLPALVACGQKEYYQAVKEQNVTMQLRMENERLVREDKDRKHEKDMVVLIEKLSVATGKTINTNDDFMAAMMLMMTQDKNNMADLSYNLTRKELQLQQIKAPDSIGDTVQKSTAAVLGLGAITGSILQSGDMSDIAITGMKNAGTHNSGGSSINTGEAGTATSSGSAINTGELGTASGSGSQDTSGDTATNTSTNTSTVGSTE